jgi:hypothetical protein
MPAALPSKNRLLEIVRMSDALLSGLLPWAPVAGIPVSHMSRANILERFAPRAQTEKPLQPATLRTGAGSRRRGAVFANGAGLRVKKRFNPVRSEVEPFARFMDVSISAFRVWPPESAPIIPVDSTAVGNPDRSMGALVKQGPAGGGETVADADNSG